VHLVMDNYGTHKPLIRNGFAKRPRFHVHFTPTYAPWLNLVERWFAELTNQQLPRGVHHSVAQLKTAIRELITAHHANPTPLSGPRALTRSSPALRASPCEHSTCRPRHLLREPRGQDIVDEPSTWESS
jgi:DDE superfamily endonuclease